VKKPVLVLLAFFVLLAAIIGGAWVQLPDPATVRTQNPRTNALIEQRRAEAAALGRRFRPSQRWVSLDAISPRLVQAVLVSEDAGFYMHGPFDVHEIGEAARDSWRTGRRLRGASTITQQAARTLWLGMDHSWRRKAAEALLAIKMHRALPKRRILALYLNSVEWGDCVFGVEAAARHWFGTSAAQVSTAQAAVLASMLPAPRRAGVQPAPPWLSRRARRALDRMLASGRIDATEHASAVDELRRIVAGPLEPDAELDEDPPASD
jgi:monofunctional biosynthetic peptidoglycan transglycosylase